MLSSPGRPVPSAVPITSGHSQRTAWAEAGTRAVPRTPVGERRAERPRLRAPAASPGPGAGGGGGKITERARGGGGRFWPKPPARDSQIPAGGRPRPRMAPRGQGNGARGLRLTWLGRFLLKPGEPETVRDAESCGPAAGGLRPGQFGQGENLHRRTRGTRETRAEGGASGRLSLRESRP